MQKGLRRFPQAGPTCHVIKSEYRIENADQRASPGERGGIWVLRPCVLADAPNCLMQNLLAIKEVSTPNRFGGATFLGFERLTFVPIQTSLLEVSLMSESEIQWVNDYHHEVWEKVRG